jgi:hypothetical protein
MGFSIELLLVLAAIGLAVAYVARRMLRKPKRDACGPCHGSAPTGSRERERGPSAG